ncbi:MAG TPA: co-chaperone GroES [Pirellulaceae bacterium]|mgnify:CR=1 FL=1|nr:co-chaperone GroES [Pirellulaceae bacterium]
MAATATKKATKSALKLQPLGDRVVARREDSETMTAGGIVLPDNAREKPSRGVVISVGEGRLLKDGSRAPLQVKPGDRILFTSYGPDDIKVGDEELLLMREDDILAILD